MSVTCPAGWKEHRLGELAKIDRQIVEPDRIRPGTNYVGLEHITSEGAFVDRKAVDNGELASSKFAFGPEHVLYGKLRPYLRKIALPDFSGVCSTDILPIRPEASRADRAYLFHYLRQQRMVDLAEARSTGVNLPRLSPKALEDFEVFAPVDIAEQQRIAAILDKADAIRRKRRQALAETDTLLRAAYLELGGLRNASHASWPLVRIEDLAAPHRNAMRTGPFGSDLLHSEFVDKGIAVLGIDNAVQNRFAWGERRFITMEKYERLQRYRIFPRDVIVTIMGTTGRSAVVPDEIPEAITTKHLATITPDQNRVHPNFLSFAIHSDPSVTRQIMKANKGAIMAGLNLGIIKEIEIRLPPLKNQKRFADVANRIYLQQGRLVDPAVNGHHLFWSLSQRAFRGEL